ncbi:MAG: DUF5017 domain-containing protein [Bacteroidales bacterium]|nr:DUF5017 domain-containing protein [Bacteroidales bacterium]
MKNKIFCLLGFALIVFSSCQDQLSEKVNFNFTAVAENSTMSGDTMIVSKSTPVSFSFSGNADLITFYSGEAGHEYSKKDMTYVPLSELQSSYLTFTNMPQYGAIAGTLKVYISNTFTGMLLNNKKADSISLVTHNWTEITDLCNLSTTSAVIKTSSVDIKQYMGNKITLAFLYKPTDAVAIQPTWEIANLKVVSTLINGSINTVSAADIGFSALDMNNDTLPYRISGGAGVWDVTNIAAATPKIRISSTNLGQKLNNDWLVSKTALLSSRLTDKGVSVKGISNSISSYQYTFLKSGIFNITFEGRIQNFVSNSVQSKTIIIKVK